MNGDINLVYLENMLIQTLSGHNDDICCLSFAGNKGYYGEGVLASVSRDGFVKVWDVLHTNNILDIKLDANKIQQKNWFALTFAPNQGLGQKFQILIGNGNGEIFSIEIPSKPPDSKIRVHKPTSYFKNKLISHMSHSSVIFTIAVDSNSMLAITSSLDHQIIVWDLIEKKAIDSYYTFSHGVHDISVSSIEPSRVAVAIGDGVQIIRFNDNLNAVNTRRIQIQKTSKTRDLKCLSVVWHPECENRLAYGTSSGDITVIDSNSLSKTPKYTNKKSNDSSKIYGLLWGPSLEDNEESTLYSVHSSGRIYLHYISSNLVKDFSNYVKQVIKRSDIMWKTNYKHLSVGNDTGTVDIFQNLNKRLILRLRIEAFKRTILCLRWNSNKDEEISNWLAVSSYEGHINCYSLHNFLSNSNKTIEEEEEEGILQIISRPNRVLKGHSDRITSMSWCPHDSNKLVSVSYDKSALVWDVLNESPLHCFTGHRGILYTVLWSLFDPDLVYSGGEDNYIHVWRPSKQTNKIICNGSNCLQTDEYWPHLDHDINEETVVSQVLNDCINKVVFDGIFDGIPEQNGSINGLEAEEEVKRQKSLKNKIKSTKKKLNRVEKESKRISLFPLSNTIENNSTKYQKIVDIEAVFHKTIGKEVSEEESQRTLLYGNSEDIKTFVANEVSNHIKLGNKQQKDILCLLLDIKTTIEESIEQKETNPYLVSLSMSVSRNHWNKLSSILAQQLIETEAEVESYRMYRIEMSAILMLSQKRFKEAIDLLVSNNLFREALIVCKVNLNSDEMCQHILNQWAEHRKLNNDFEGAAKCLTAIKKFKPAADLLNYRNDQQFNHTISLLKSYKN